MLVLSRRRKEKLVIGAGIEIVVLQISSDGVKLGVTAPEDVPIYRGELFEQIAEQNLAATSPRSNDVADELLAALRGRMATTTEEE